MWLEPGRTHVGRRVNSVAAALLAPGREARSLYARDALDARGRLPASSLDFSERDCLDVTHARHGRLLLSQVDEDQIARADLEAAALAFSKLSGRFDHLFGQRSPGLGRLDRRCSISRPCTELVCHEAKLRVFLGDLGAGSTGASPLFSKEKRHRDLHPSLKYVPREREVEVGLRELAKVS